MAVPVLAGTLRQPQGPSRASSLHRSQATLHGGSQGCCLPSQSPHLLGSDHERVWSHCLSSKGALAASGFLSPEPSRATSPPQFPLGLRGQVRQGKWAGCPGAPTLLRVPSNSQTSSYPPWILRDSPPPRVPFATKQNQEKQRRHWFFRKLLGVVSTQKGKPPPLWDGECCLPLALGTGILLQSTACLQWLQELIHGRPVKGMPVCRQPRVLHLGGQMGNQELQDTKVQITSEFTEEPLNAFFSSDASKNFLCVFVGVGAALFYLFIFN